MRSFEELSLDPGIVEALADEGVEVPTSLQSDAIPVLLRGNNAVLAAGPGAGALVAYGSSLLQRVEPNLEGPSILVAVPITDIGEGLAESLARIAAATGHSVAVLDRAWALPQRADVLFGTPQQLVEGLSGGLYSAEGVRAVVTDGVNIIEARAGLDGLLQLYESVPGEVQRVLVSLPITEGVDTFARKHLARSVRIPADRPETDLPTARGEVGYRIVGEDKEHALASVVAGFLADDVRHVLLHFRSEDRAADFGDFLTLHGYVGGAVGDESVPVWLAVDALEARKALEASGIAPGDFASVSVDVPSDVDVFDRRHGFGLRQLILALPRELHHLRRMASLAGYVLRPREEGMSKVDADVEALRRRVSKAAGSADLAPFGALLEPLLDTHSGYELAAAALYLLVQAESVGTGPTHPKSSVRAQREPSAPARLFVSLGEKDGVRPKDVLGALAGESGVDGSHFGKIEIRETFSVVEVDPAHARDVIRAVNGRTIRGRSVRVDYDRPGSGRAARSGRAQRKP